MDVILVGTAEKISSGASGEILDLSLAKLKGEHDRVGDVALDVARLNFTGFMASAAFSPSAPDRVTDEVWHQLIGLGDDATLQFFESAGISPVGHNPGYGRDNLHEREALVDIFGGTVRNISTALGQEEQAYLDRAHGLMHELGLKPEIGLPQIVTACSSELGITAYCASQPGEISPAIWREDSLKQARVDDAKRSNVVRRFLRGKIAPTSDRPKEPWLDLNCVDCPINDNCLAVRQHDERAQRARQWCAAYRLIDNARLLEDEVLVDLPQRKLTISEGARSISRDGRSPERGEWKLSDRDNNPILGPIDSNELNDHKVG